MLALFPERLLLVLDYAGDDSTTSSIVTSQAVPEPSQEVETITQVMDQHIHDECEFIEVPFRMIFMRVYAFCTGAKFIPLFISYTYSRYDDNKVGVMSLRKMHWHSPLITTMMTTPWKLFKLQ